MQFFSSNQYTHSRNVPVRWQSEICPSRYAWLAVCAMIFYLAMFAPGFGPMPWTINAEIYPLWARNAGTSASTATNWVSALSQAHCVYSGHKCLFCPNILQLPCFPIDVGP